MCDSFIAHTQIATIQILLIIGDRYDSSKKSKRNFSAYRLLIKQKLFKV
ncbi:MAG: hypothetical protein HC917_09550 [Richelia sp. SM2_1_7]|nr:hypothetical protein [Richelia sp. SM2_1_7]